VLPCRYLRARWQQGYLKDLYHRRVLAGGEPLIHRSSLPNWDYNSEIFAFRHRIYGDDKENGHFVRALTNSSFFDRKDVSENASFSQPSLEEEISSREDNSELISEGTNLLNSIITGYFRAHFPKAPEEFISALTDVLASDEVLSDAATALGMQHLVRTGEFPPAASSLADAFKAVLTVLSPERRQRAVVDIIIPKAVQLPLEDILPFKNPLAIATDYATKCLSAKSVEPRVMHSSGQDSATPLWVVGVYADEKLIGSAPGETLTVAVDLAAQATLLRLWGVTTNTLLTFGEDVYQKNLSSLPKNHSLYEICDKERDLTLLTREELSYDPLDVLTIASNIKEIEKEIGIPKWKHLRHKFSRGSLFRRSFRYLVKPRPHSI